MKNANQKEYKNRSLLLGQPVNCYPATLICERNACEYFKNSRTGYSQFCELIFCEQKFCSQYFIHNLTRPEISRHICS